MKKRGQATVFIIIGIVILVVIFGVVAIKNGYFNLALSKIGLIKEIPIELKPVDSFMSSCVGSVGKKGIDLLASQGGYIVLPSDNIPNSPFAPLGTSLDVLPGSDIRSSVWFREKGNGVQDLNVPSVETMQSELGNYVDNHIGVCINNLTSFSSQGYIFTINDFPKTKAEIHDSYVLFNVEMPVSVKIRDSNFSLSNFQSSVDSSLGSTFNVAKDILNRENQDLFFENKTIAMLVAYDDEVPYTGIDFSCTEKVWNKAEVIAKLKNIIYENIAATGVKGSSRQSSKDLDFLQLDKVSSASSDVDINFLYNPEWPTVVEVNPSEGNILRSNSVTRSGGSAASALLSSFVCMSDHRFVYNIKYPVLVIVRGKDGLVFQYAFEVLIANNQPRKNELPDLNIPNVDNTICKYPQKDVTIATATYDANGELAPLDNVDLTFNCFPANCPIGVSQSVNNPAPLLKTKIPLCFNGIVEGRKSGYYQGKSLYSSNNEDSPNVLVALEPLYKKGLNVFVIDKDSGNPRKPYDSEQVTLQFTNNDLGYSTYINYPSEDNKIELLAGDYQVTAYIIRNSTWDITIKKQVLENCVDTRSSGLFGFFKTDQHCEQTTIDPMSFNQVVTGGEVFNFNFDRHDLAADNSLNIYVLSDTIPGNADDMQKIQIEILTNKDHPKFKYPDFS